MSGSAPDAGAPLAARQFARILLIKPSSLGDVVHALPVLHGLRRRFPAARIDWLISESCAGLIRGHPAVTELVIFERRRFGRLGRSLTATGEFARFLSGLRARDYDLVIDLQGLFRSGFMAFASGAPVRLGFASARELAGLFYTHRIPAPRGAVHAAERNYGVGSMLGFAEEPMNFDLALSADEQGAASELLAREGLGSGQPFIAVLPGARWETKRWLPERFAAVIDRVAADGLPCMLMGAANERDLCEAIATRCRRRPINLAGRTGLRQLAAVLGRAAVVLCHDSAPMHLAAAQHRPLVALLGPTNPARTGPYGRSAVVLQADLPCVPCYLRRLEQCPYDHACMKELSVEQVLATVRKLFEPTIAPVDK